MDRFWLFRILFSFEATLQHVCLSLGFLDYSTSGFTTKSASHSFCKDEIPTVKKDFT